MRARLSAQEETTTTAAYRIMQVEILHNSRRAKRRRKVFSERSPQNSVALRRHHRTPTPHSKGMEDTRSNSSTDNIRLSSTANTRLNPVMDSIRRNLVTDMDRRREPMVGMADTRREGLVVVWEQVAAPRLVSVLDCSVVRLSRIPSMMEEMEVMEEMAEMEAMAATVSGVREDLGEADRMER